MVKEDIDRIKLSIELFFNIRKCCKKGGKTREEYRYEKNAVMALNEIVINIKLVPKCKQ